MKNFILDSKKWELPFAKTLTERIGLCCVLPLAHLHRVGRRLLPTLVDADGHVGRLRAVLVAHKDAVLAGVLHGDVIDGDAAALGLLGDDELALVEDLPVVPQPEDLWGRLAIDEAGQAQGLDGGQRVNSLQREA